MDHTQFVLPRSFSHFSLSQLSIPDELLDHLSLLKIDDEEDRTSVTKHIYDFLHFCESHEINNDELVCIIFFLTLEGHANRWCQTLPPDFVHSLLTLLKELNQTFNKCNHQDVYERISHLRMKPSESVEDFATCFLHLCHEIPEQFVDLDFMSQELKRLVHVS